MNGHSGENGTEATPVVVSNGEAASVEQPVNGYKETSPVKQVKKAIKERIILSTSFGDGEPESDGEDDNSGGHIVVTHDETTEPATATIKTEEPNTNAIATVANGEMDETSKTPTPEVTTTVEVKVEPVTPVTEEKIESPVTKPEPIQMKPELKEESPKASRASPLSVRPSQYFIPDVGDRYKPAKSLISTQPDEGVLLRYTNSGALSDPPMLISTMLEKTTANFPEMIAMAVKRDGEWKKWTFTEMIADTRTVAKAFIHLGLERFHSVGIMGFNAPEWFLANFGAIYAGGLSAGIYATNNPEACEWQLKDSRTNICVVENDKQMEKILKVWPNVPELKAVIQWIGKPSVTDNPKVMAWSDLVELGRTLPNTDLETRMADLAVNQCCTLIYTSGTTGHPKGVMLSHDNLTWTACQCSKMARARPGGESNVSYLPLSHVAAQVMDMYIPYSFGCTVYFAQPDALRGSLVNTLQECRPTLLLGVPRVWEKIQLKLTEQIGKSPSFKRSLIRWARTMGARGFRARDNGEEMPVGWNLANTLVFKKVHKALGLDKAVLMFTGAAPVMTETLEFFRSFDLRVLDAYGMSETSCPHTINWPHAYRFGSSGKAISGAITHIKDPGEDSTGEICIEGRHVFMGYLFNKEQTMESLDENGWLHTGDVGKVDEDGYLFITGRLKELIITAGGENVPPITIEDSLKAELPILSQAMVIGDRRKFLSALLTLKSEIDLDTMMPRDRLAPPTIQWATSIGSKSTRISEILEKTDLPILKAIQAAVDRVNERSTSQAQRIQKWTLLPRDFSIPGGELGPTLKMRRSVIAKMYKDTIESFYSGQD